VPPPIRHNAWVTDVKYLESTTRRENREQGALNIIFSRGGELKDANSRLSTVVLPRYAAIGHQIDFTADNRSVDGRALR
jgi:hypothetical protein